MERMTNNKQLGVIFNSSKEKEAGTEERRSKPAITAKSFWLLLPCCSLSLFAVTV